MDKFVRTTGHAEPANETHLSTPKQPMVIPASQLCSKRRNAGSLLTYLVPALTATIEEPNNVVIRGVLIKGGGSGEEVGITPSGVSGGRKQYEFVVYFFLSLVLAYSKPKIKSRTFPRMLKLKL